MTDAADLTGAEGALRLAELLCARLCHDVASPLGSLAAAVELAADDLSAIGGGSAVEALDIAKAAAAALSARVRMLRAAWGGDCGAMSAAEITELAAHYPSRRLTLDLAGLTDDSYPAPIARVLLNLLLLGLEALPFGGALAAAGSLGTGIAIIPRGTRAAWPAGFTANVSGGGVKLPSSPREVQGPLTLLLAREAGLRLSLLMAGSADGQPPPLLLSRP